MAATATDVNQKVFLDWERADIENRLGCRGGKFTSVNTTLCFICAAILTVLFYLCLRPFPDAALTPMFTQRGLIPYFIMAFSFWSVTILIIKQRKLMQQRKALDVSIGPPGKRYVITTDSVEDVLERIHDQCPSPQHFVYLRRITLALQNLRNMGRVSDVEAVIRAQAESDENFMMSTYTMIRGFIWGIPVMGFIGTVKGLSGAIAGFGSVLSGEADMDLIKAALRDVTGNLATAFETTFIALVAALAIQLLMTALHKQEEEFYDLCADRCLEQVVARLRLTELPTTTITAESDGDSHSQTG